MSEGVVAHLVINLVGEGAHDVPKSGAPKSNLDVQGASGEGAGMVVLALLESVLDEIDCVDDFGSESDDPGSDSETFPGGGSSTVEHPRRAMVTALAVLKDGGSPLGPRGARSEVSDAESIGSAKSLARMEWYPVEGFTAPWGFDCSGVDASSSLIY